ncbi:hypothetical protein H6G17_26580 [Chroococcidiopsis sp. FACHB-1243]|uniref:hypothetical protein n=1 Tax=Chroococcidiopsis sp. [FACHB-1243] TaxID=2692781 RepID=UPI001780A750|nr:hypothetical protein [Chroococcidiopsis sp. [FACHB-1243]]MBD2309034.1 hypothetical protein [Chroococcidiopsis sp. [FACHB-1243]]
MEMTTSDRRKIQAYFLPNFIAFAIDYIKKCQGMRRILKRTKTSLFSRIQSANLKVETQTQQGGRLYHHARLDVEVEILLGKIPDRPPTGKYL